MEEDGIRPDHAPYAQHTAERMRRTSNGALCADLFGCATERVRAHWMTRRGS